MSAQTENQNFPAGSLRGMVIRRFPIIKTHHAVGIPQRDWIPWELLSPHEAQALSNHDQTLERLAQRGGLDACEAVAIIDDMSFYKRWLPGTQLPRDKMREAIERLEELCKPYNA